VQGASIQCDRGTLLPIFGLGNTITNPPIYLQYITEIFHPCNIFLSRYVPKVAKRTKGLFNISVSMYWRPTYHLETFKWPISPQGVIRSTHVSFCSEVGFSGSADQMALFPVWPNSVGTYRSKQWARSSLIRWSQSKYFFVQSWSRFSFHGRLGR